MDTATKGRSKRGGQNAHCCIFRMGGGGCLLLTSIIFDLLSPDLYCKIDRYPSFLAKLYSSVCIRFLANFLNVGGKCAFFANFDKVDSFASNFLNF